MANCNPPKKNQALTFTTYLFDPAVANSFKSSPTLTLGDWKVNIDGAGANNLGTTPTASGVEVTITLSAAEMNGDRISITGISSASPKNFVDFGTCILTTA